MKASSYKGSEARHIIVYGSPKTGKTELIGTLAAKYRLWWFNLDGGIKTLLAPGSAACKNLDNIELFTLPDSQRFPVAVQTLLKVFKGGPHKICHKHGICGCPAPECKPDDTWSLFDIDKLEVDKDVVVVDHMAQLMDSVNNWIHREALKNDNWDGLKSEFSDWAKHGAMSDRFGSTWQNAPYNMVLASQEVMAKMPDGSTKLVPVGGTRNQSSDFARYFDDVVYTEIIGGQYRATCTAGDKSQVVIGSRTGKKLTVPKAGERTSLLELFA